MSSLLNVKPTERSVVLRPNATVYIYHNIPVSGENSGNLKPTQRSVEIWQNVNCVYVSTTKLCEDIPNVVKPTERSVALMPISAVHKSKHISLSEDTGNLKPTKRSVEI